MHAASSSRAMNMLVALSRRSRSRRRSRRCSRARRRSARSEPNMPPTVARRTAEHVIGSPGAGAPVSRTRAEEPARLRQGDLVPFARRDPRPLGVQRSAAPATSPATPRTSARSTTTSASIVEHVASVEHADRFARTTLAVDDLPGARKRAPEQADAGRDARSSIDRRSWRPRRRRHRRSHRSCRYSDSPRSAALWRARRWRPARRSSSHAVREDPLRRDGIAGEQLHLSPRGSPRPSGACRPRRTRSARRAPLRVGSRHVEATLHRIEQCHERQDEAAPGRRLAPLDRVSQQTSSPRGHRCRHR